MILNSDYQLKNKLNIYNKMYNKFNYFNTK